MSKETSAALYKMLCAKEALTVEEKILIAEDYEEFSRREARLSLTRKTKSV